jgi:hypothetical protein
MVRVFTRRQLIRCMEALVAIAIHGVLVVGFLTAMLCLRVSWPQFINGGVKMKRVIAALSLLAIISPAIAQPAEVTRMFDCSAFTHILWACLPPSNARDSANAMASAFMSAGMQRGRERHMSDGKLNTVAMAALQRQRAKTGNTCSRLDALVRNYGNLCDALMDSQRADTERLKHPDPTAAAN